MAFTATATITGLEKTFRVSPTCKRYTLRDNGFVETKAGNFVLTRELDNQDGQKKHVLLKISVSKDITLLKMSTTTANGLQAVNVFQLNNAEVLIEKMIFLLDGLVDRGVLVTD